MMSRLTKKLEIDVPLSILYKLNDYVSLIDVINKLGELEDLLEKHDIDSIEELERKINKKSFVVFAGGRHSGKTLMTKGLLYERLSEKLGCPLEVVFKVLLKKEGIRTIKNNTYYINNIVRLSTGNLAFALESAHYLHLKDYQKTWWLKGEKENE